MVASYFGSVHLRDWAWVHCVFSFLCFILFENVGLQPEWGEGDRGITFLSQGN